MRRFYLEKKWKKAAVAVVLALLAGGIYFLSFGRDKVISSGDPLPIAEESKESPSIIEEADSRLIAVHICGAVKNPDRVYYLREGARVEEAVIAAGGVTDSADLEQVNLAALLKDGQKLRIPLKGEEIEEETEENPQTLLTNINFATKIELQNLPGIGETYANRIVEYRTREGDFQKIEDIMKVKGIGEKIFAEIKELITVG